MDDCGMQEGKAKQTRKRQTQGEQKATRTHRWSMAPCRRRYMTVFWTTLLANQSTHSSTTSNPMRGKMMEALALMLRHIMPVPSSSGASIGSDTCPSMFTGNVQ